MKNLWTPEEDTQNIQPDNPKPVKPDRPIESYRSEAKRYKPCAHIVLFGSDTESWGLAIDSKNNIFIKRPEEGEIVGTWTRSPIDNRIRLSLETSLEALTDMSVLRMMEHVKMRTEDVEHAKSSIVYNRRNKGSRSRQYTIPEQPKPDPRINQLRNLLKG